MQCGKNENLACKTILNIYITYLTGVYLLTGIVSIYHFKNTVIQTTQNSDHFPEPLFPPIPVTSRVESGAERQHNNPRMWRQTSPSSRPRYSLQRLIVRRDSCPNSTSVWRAGGVETTKSEILNLVLSVLAECEESLWF